MFGISFGPVSVTVTQAADEYTKAGNCLLDVRNENEIATISVPGSVNIPLPRLKSELDSLKKYSSIYVMCHSGVRSKMATKLLIKNGLTQAINVKGGIVAWKSAGLPLK